MHRNATALALILASLPLAALAQRGAKPERTETIDYPEMRRDLETMRRILERQAFDVRSSPSGKQDDKPAEGRGRATSAGGGASGLGGGTASANDETLSTLLAYTHATTESHGGYSLWSGNSEAYYVPGDGALFLMRTSTALTPPPSESAEKEESKEPSLWDEVRSEVDGRGRGTVFLARRAGASYDAAAVDALKSRLLLALAKYGSKIGQLSDSQHLTIVMRGGSTGLGTLNLTGRVTTATGSVDVSEPGNVPIARWSTGSYGFDGGGSVLTIRVSRADVMAYAAGSLDLDAFKQRAKIAQY